MEFEAGLCELRRSSGLLCLMLCCPCYCTPCLVQSAVVSKATKAGQAWWCLLALMCCCFGTALNRGVLRRQYRIQGRWWRDLLVHLFCSVCAIAQEYREVNSRQGKAALGLLGKQFLPQAEAAAEAPSDSTAFYN